MSSKVFWKSLLVTPALLGATMIVSSSAIAAEAQSSPEVDALLNEVAAASSLETASRSTSTDTFSADALSTTALSAEAAPAQVSVAPVEAPAAPLAPVVAPAAAPAVEAAPQAIAPAAAPTQIAQAAPTQIAPTAPQAAPSSLSNVSSVDELSQYSNDASSMSQVTSISQLSDVQPTDWAFQALQSLVERYGCIVGYPDSQYRGSRALTRFEFAAGLNACLDRISELIASTTADLATKEDLATLQRLQEEFAAELATLRGRVDSLEARTAELEANQFSTTTKLKGETIFAVGIPLDGDEDVFPDDQVIAGYRVRLNFDTSFTGEDLLRARLQARDFNTLNSFGGGTSNLAWKFSGDDSDSGASDNITLQKLFYTFPVGDRIQITLGAQGMSDSDWVTSTVSPFDDDGAGSLTSFGAPAQYNYIPGDAGAGIIFQLTDSLSLDLGYGAAEPDNPNPGNGLFNGDYGLIAQLTYLSDFVDAALTYANGYSDSGFGSLSGAGDAEVANTYGGQVNFKFGSLEIGGGVAYVPIRRIGVGDYDIWSYQATLAFRDFGGEGNMLGVLAGVQPYASAVPIELSGPVNQDNSFLVETFYRFQVNDNISVTPGLIWISNPGNDEATSDTFVGAIRTTFSF